MKKIAILIPAFRPHIFFNVLFPELKNQIEELGNEIRFHCRIIAVIPEEVSLEKYANALSCDYLMVIKTNGSGFSVPRNLLWDAAKEYDLNIFLDDDQVPNSSWLREMLQAVECNPGFSLYVGSQQHLGDFHDNEYVSSILLPPPSRGNTDGNPTSSDRITNTAFIRTSIENLVSPFPLYFRDGGEDIYFLHLLKNMNCRSFQAEKASVTERWDNSRMNSRVLVSRQIRGIRAYYKLRLIALGKKWEWGHDAPRVYGRLILLVFCAPFILSLLMANSLNPYRVLRIRIFLMISRFYSASTIPWILKINLKLGRDRFDIL